MTVGKINITKAIEDIQVALNEDKNMSASMRTMITLLITIVNLLTEKIGLNSKNSSTPPSQDPNRLKNKKKTKPKSSDLMQRRSTASTPGLRSKRFQKTR